MKQVGLLVGNMIVKLLHLILFPSSFLGFHITDKTYRAVIGANEALGEQKYHIVGGSAGSVSPCKFAFITNVTRHTLQLPLTTCSCVSRLVLPGRT